MLALIRNGQAVTRADMARYTGLARSTVSLRLELLIAQRLVREVGSSSPTGGRPGTVLAFNPGAGALLVADVDRTGARLAISDLGGTLLAEQTVPFAHGADAEAAFERLDQRFLALLERTNRRLTDVRGIGLAVPGPGAMADGTLVASPHLPGWEGFPARDWLAARYDALTIVDKRASLMALGEHVTYWQGTDELLYVTAGTQISSGIITGGQLYRGTHGLAGEIGHLPIAWRPGRAVRVRERGLPGGRGEPACAGRAARDRARGRRGAREDRRSGGRRRRPRGRAPDRGGREHVREPVRSARDRRRRGAGRRDAAAARRGARAARAPVAARGRAAVGHEPPG